MAYQYKKVWKNMERMIKRGAPPCPKPRTVRVDPTETTPLLDIEHPERYAALDLEETEQDA